MLSPHGQGQNRKGAALNCACASSRRKGPCHLSILKLYKSPQSAAAQHPARTLKRSRQTKITIATQAMQHLSEAPQLARNRLGSRTCSLHFRVHDFWLYNLLDRMLRDWPVGISNEQKIYYRLPAPATKRRRSTICVKKNAAVCFDRIFTGKGRNRSAQVTC